MCLENKGSCFLLSPQAKKALHSRLFPGFTMCSLAVQMCCILLVTFVKFDRNHDTGASLNLHLHRCSMKVVTGLCVIMLELRNKQPRND